MAIVVTVKAAILTILSALVHVICGTFHFVGGAVLMKQSFEEVPASSLHTSM